MQGKRIHRVGHQLQMEIGRLLLSKMKDPRLGFVTVTHVDVSPDLKSACVFYSVLGQDDVKRDTQKALEKSAGFMQREIAKVVKLRYTPKLIFRFDDSLDRGMEIDRVIRDIHQKEEGRRDERS